MKVNDRVVYFKQAAGGWRMPPTKFKGRIIELTRTRAKIIFDDGKTRTVDRDTLEIVK